MYGCWDCEYVIRQLKNTHGMNEEFVNMLCLLLISFRQSVYVTPGQEINCNPAGFHLTFDLKQIKGQTKKKADQIFDLDIKLRKIVKSHGHIMEPMNILHFKTDRPV